MNEVKQKVILERSADFVFDFTLNPENTPKWISSIVQEQVNEAPTKLGTIYRNQRSDGVWSEYEVTAFQPGVMFVFTKKADEYHVKYTFKKLGDNRCELEYREWTDSGNVQELFSEDELQGVLQKLKSIVESS